MIARNVLVRKGDSLEEIVVQLWKEGCVERGERKGERERDTSTGPGVRRSRLEPWLHLSLELCDLGAIEIAMLASQGRCEGKERLHVKMPGKQYELNDRGNLNEFRFQHVEAQEI